MDPRCSIYLQINTHNSKNDFHAANPFTMASCCVILLQMYIHSSKKGLPNRGISFFLLQKCASKSDTLVLKTTNHHCNVLHPGYPYFRFHSRVEEYKLRYSLPSRLYILCNFSGMATTAISYPRNSAHGSPPDLKC